MIAIINEKSPFKSAEKITALKIPDSLRGRVLFRKLQKHRQRLSMKQNFPMDTFFGNFSNSFFLEQLETTNPDMCYENLGRRKEIKFLWAKPVK